MHEQAREIPSGPPGVWDVEDWRLKQLIEADYPVDLATKLAVRSDVDLHQAIELVRQGCRPDVAAEILL